jgi:CHAT domain-containing protein
LSLAPDAARALAQRWPDPALAWPTAGTDLLALAWAFKDECYAAWSSDPALAVRAADGLRALPRAGATPLQAREIQGLAEWTAGIACLTRGEMAGAVQCFDRAAADLRAAGQPDPAAQSQVPKIMALSMLGEHAAATACAESAQRELLALGNRRAAARVSQNLGVLQLRHDAYAEAARHFREAGVLFARLGDPVNSVLADIGLADTLTAHGDVDEALRIYARGRMRAGNQGLALQLALVDESVALLDLARGQYRPALAGLESARRRYEALAMPQYLAIAEKQLGDAYLELRLLPEALALFDAAVAKFAALALPVEQAWALAQRGRALALLNQAAAADALAAAAALFAAQDNAAGSASVALARAELALAGGGADRLADAAASPGAEAAAAWAGQAVAGFTEAAQADGLGRAEVVQAQAWLQAGRVADADTGFARALARAQAGQQGALRVRCLTGQGLVALARADADKASALFEAAIDALEDQRLALPGDEVRGAFLTDHLVPYLAQYRRALASGDASAALWQLERCRARALDDRLAAGPVAAADDPAQALRERLNWLYRRVRRLHDEGESAAGFMTELWRTEAELLERARRERLAAPLPSGPLAAEFSVQALQAVLQPGDALVVYSVIDDELLAFVVTPHQVRLHRQLAAWPTVADAVQSLRFQLETLRHGAAPVRQHLPALTARTQARLARLHALVWAPLAPQLAACQRVLVVPHGALGAVPFAALCSGADAQPLGWHHQLAMAPSARTALHGLLRPPVAAVTAVALGESSQLPQAAAEARRVAGLFGQGQALVGEQASLAALRRHAQAADVLHLACHAQFRSDNPRFSALHLQDGALTVDQAESLGLRPCTVVLSACETGLADAGAGDEMVGLVRAFLVAGAARVLASQWPVDDDITAGFMACFYGALAQGACPAAALQAAQAATARAHPHPYHWAAFTLFGGW